VEFSTEVKLTIWAHASITELLSYLRPPLSSACSRGKKFFFFAVNSSICKLGVLVYVTSKQLYPINFSSWISPLYRRTNKGKLYSVIDSPVHGRHDGEKFSSVPQFVLSYNCFCKWLHFIFPVQSILLLSLIYRAVAPKVVGMWL